MIRYLKGNLLGAQAEALVNTVNTEGVMGKGIALQFKEAFPENFRLYREACKRGEVRPGKMFFTRTNALIGPAWIINFPTKTSWRQPSRLQYLVDGLRDLARVIRETGVQSVGVPPLGCGHGGLDWAQVRPLIESALGDLPGVDVLVFEPSGEYMGAPKRSGVEELTVARALIVESIRRYAELGFECTNLEVQKLVYFLTRVLACRGLDDPFKLNFAPNKFGPYADRLRHMLDGLDGSYLHCERRLADAGPLDPIALDMGRVPAARAYLDADSKGRDYVRALDDLGELIDGFESPFLMELLSTVDVLQVRAKRPLTGLELREGVRKWPVGKGAAERKDRLFSDSDLRIAAERLAALAVAIPS